MRNRAGFTLIEVIVTMVLVGIMAAVVGMGGASYIRGYATARENRDKVQKAQIAMARINRELRELQTIRQTQTSPTTSITYTRLANGATSTVTQTLAQSGNTITLNGNTLLDSVPVNAFTLTYSQGSLDWVNGTDAINLLSAIGVRFSLTPSTGDSNMTFATTITPRNNGNAGGTQPPTSAPPAYASAGACFVATAAFGNMDHPMVMLLREFRDRYLQAWEPGRRFIDVYYSIGPFLSNAIRNRPWACFITRMLLAPVVGMVFFIMYLPVAIPIILIPLWCVAHLVLHVCAKIRKRRIHVMTNQSGSILIMLIVVITILAILGVGMVSFLPTSSLSQIEGLASLRAYYMAESGYRYAAGQFQGQTGLPAKYLKMENLNSKIYNVGNGGRDGQFQLTMIPYFQVLSTDYPSGATTLLLKYPGTPPTSGYTLPPSGTFDINTDNNTSTLNAYSYSTTGSTITISPGLGEAIAVNNSLRFVTAPATAGTLNSGGDLTVGTAGPFPPYHGTFTVYRNGNKRNAATYSYTTKSGNVLQDVTTDTSGTLPLTLLTADNIVCNEYVVLQSKGKYYAGTGMEAARTLTYYTPIGLVAQQGQSGTTTTVQSSTMNDSTEWYSPSVGTTTFSNDSSGYYMQLSTDNSSGAWSENVWGAVAQKSLVNFYSSWYYFNYLLSYDAQVKIDIYPSSITYKYYLAGMSFRIQTADDDSAYSYGLSFLRSSSESSIFLFQDGIPDGLTPTNSSGTSLVETPMIVLWRRTSAGYKWLAYKLLGTDIVSSSIYIKKWSTLLVRITENYDSGSSGSKHNLIRCYYATNASNGTSNSTPTDVYRLEYPRQTDTLVSDSIKWPTILTEEDSENGGTWTSEKDYFTLIKWNRVNTSISVDNTTGTGKEEGCVIKDSALTTPSSGTLTTSEIGLHAAGKSGTYFTSNISPKFDDFSIRYESPNGGDYGFTFPIQQ